MPGSGPGGRWFKSIRPDHFLRFSASQSSVDFGTIPGWFSVLVRQEGHEMWRGSAACLKNGLAWCVELKCRRAVRFAEFTRLGRTGSNLAGNCRPLEARAEGYSCKLLSGRISTRRREPRCFSPARCDRGTTGLRLVSRRTNRWRGLHW